MTAQRPLYPPPLWRRAGHASSTVLYTAPKPPSPTWEMRGRSRRDTGEMKPDEATLTLTLRAGAKPSVARSTSAAVSTLGRPLATSPAASRDCASSSSSRDRSSSSRDCSSSRRSARRCCSSAAASAWWGDGGDMREMWVGCGEIWGSCREVWGSYVGDMGLRLALTAQPRAGQLLLRVRVRIRARFG